MSHFAPEPSAAKRPERLTMKTLITFVSVLVLALTSGCSTGQVGARSTGFRILTGQNFITVTNNTDSLIDLEHNSRTVVKDLVPGQSYTNEVFSMRNGEKYTMVAKVHDEAGNYLGMQTKTFSLTSGYGGIDHQTYDWEVHSVRKPVKAK